MRGFLVGSKTYVVAGVLVLYGLSGYFTGNLEAMEAVLVVVNGLGLGALRNGITNG